VAGAVLPGERHCQLRAEVVRGTDPLRCDLRHSEQREHIGHRRSAERRHHLYPVLLQRCGWRGYWWTKLHLATLRHAVTNTYGDCDLHAYGDSDSYSHTDANTHSHSNSYRDGHTNAYCDFNSTGYSHTETSPNAAASAVKVTSTDS